jgi:putative peptidoglycan lipid II flippase
MGIPLGVVIGSLTTVLLPQFSRMALHSKKRLAFYVFESIKMVLWITLPVMILMMLTSYHLFYTLFLSPSFTIAHVHTASRVLQAFCLGLPFLALNRLLLNVLYAMHKTNVPPIISGLAVIINIAGNMLFLHKFRMVGLALATSLSAFFQMIFLIMALHYYKCPISIKKCAIFLTRYMIQLSAVGLPLFFLYFTVRSFLSELPFAFVLDTRFGFWYIAFPFCGLYMVLLWALRKKSGLHIFFID